MAQDKLYTKQELERKVMNYEMLEGVGFIIIGAGLISLVYGPTANLVESRLHPIEPPAIVRTYNDAQITINSLRKDKNKLEETIERYPYTPQTIEEIGDIKEIKKSMSEYDNVINSIEKDISKIEGDSDFIKYRDDVRLRVEKQEKRKIYHSLGFLGSTLGLIPSYTGLIKKKWYQLKLKELKNKK